MPPQLRKLLYGEGKVGVGEWFIAKGKVPPFCIHGLKAMGEHGATKNHAMRELFGGDASANGTLMVVASIFATLWVAAEIGMALRTKPVECTTHIQFLFRCHVE